MIETPSTRDRVTTLHRGFTLVEMMVVIAILSILLLLLLPVLSGIRESTRRTVCASQLGQVGTAVAAYAVDHHRSLPLHHQDAALPFDTMWMRRPTGEAVNLGLVLGNSGSGVYHCPSQSSANVAFSTAVNPWNGGQGVPGVVLRSSYAARVRPVVGGVNWRVNNYANRMTYTCFLGVDGLPPTGSFTAPLRASHQGSGFNSLFGDGAAIWANADGVNDTRKVDSIPPVLAEMLAYHDVVDLTPSTGGDDDDDGEGEDDADD